MLNILLTAMYVGVCLLLLVVVLMQQGKGGDIAAAFGGSGSGNQSAFSARAGASVLTRATTVLGAMFMVGAMTLAIMGQRDTGSLLSGVEGPDVQPAETVSVPVEIDPAHETPAEEPSDPPAEPQ